MRKGQVWYTDFIVGVMIFSIVVISYFYFVEHSEPADQNLANYLLTESKTITNYLVTEGYPQNWTAGNVSTVGLTNGNHRINDTKLGYFSSWSYDERRQKMRTTKDYYFFLEYLNGTKYNELCSDSPGCTDWNSSYHLVQNTRYVIHDSEIVRMRLYIYENT